jgi:hypothetical protein
VLVASRMNLHDVEATLRRIAALGKVPVQITRMMSDDSSLVLHPEGEAILVERLAAVRADFPEASIYFNPMNTGALGTEKCCGCRLSQSLYPCRRVSDALLCSHLSRALSEYPG